MLEPFFQEVGDLVNTDPKAWPLEFSSNSHLIYSSPATLSFNSPGAEGFGVKRAALTLPDSVMLLFSPGCCGRNTSALGGPESHYGKRTYYLLLDETDIVTGRYLPRILEAAKEIVALAKPKVLILCSTCVVALLGTDMERLCREIKASCQVEALAATMYALTREGHLPPMVLVRKTLYSLLKKAPKRADTVNILGFFTPLNDQCELYSLLAKVGLKHIYELSRMTSLESYQAMAQANFNLVLHPEARYAANYLKDTLEIPAIELLRTFQLSKITKQYQLLSQILEVNFNLEPYLERATKEVEEFSSKFKGLNLALSDGVNGNPWDLTLTIQALGLNVKEIFAEVTSQDLPWLKAIAKLSPHTKIYSNLHPSMLGYVSSTKIDIALGKAARYYHPKAYGFDFTSETQPFGYQGLQQLLKELEGVAHARSI